MCLYCLAEFVIHDLSNMQPDQLLIKAPRHLAQHYKLSAAQSIITASLKAIELTVIEQSKKHKYFTIRHIYTLLACKQANELLPYISRRDIRNTIKELGYNMSSIHGKVNLYVNSLCEYDMINTLRPSKSGSPDLYIITMYGSSILRRLSHHFNATLRSMDSIAKRRAALDMPYQTH